MSEHKLTKIGNIMHVTSVYTPEKMSEIDVLKMIAPVEIPELRKQVAALQVKLNASEEALAEAGKDLIKHGLACHEAGWKRARDYRWQLEEQLAESEAKNKDLEEMYSELFKHYKAVRSVNVELQNKIEALEAEVEI